MMAMDSMMASPFMRAPDLSNIPAMAHPDGMRTCPSFLIWLTILSVERPLAGGRATSFSIRRSKIAVKIFLKIFYL